MLRWIARSVPPALRKAGWALSSPQIDLLGQGVLRRWARTSTNAGLGLSPELRALLLDRLRATESRFVALSDALVAASEQGGSTVVALQRELGELQPLIDALSKYRALSGEEEELQSLIGDHDPDIAAAAATELAPVRVRLEEAEGALATALLPTSQEGGDGTILEIRAGTGGQEASIFASDLFRMYALYSAQQGWRFEDCTAAAATTLVARLPSAAAYACLRFESGVHRVQRVPATESKGRMHTSAASVAVLPVVQASVTVIRPDDVEMEAMRASGAGGQHVNTTDSAVRLTHIPTGTVVQCSAERSQHKNRATAMQLLAARIADTERQEHVAKEARHRRSLLGSGDRSERIRTYNFPENRVTDHRLGLTVNGLAEVMSGTKLEMFIRRLKLQHQLEILTDAIGTSGTRHD